MAWWHRHRWSEIRRTYSKSDVQRTNYQGPEALDWAREAMFGVTVVELRCDGCGLVRFARTVGRSG